MSTKFSGILFGIGLISLGLLLIVNMFLDFYFSDAYLVALVFGVATLWFASKYLRDTLSWWWLIFASISLIVTISIVFGESRSIDNDLIGVGVNWTIGLTFLAVYLRNKKYWWPIIPAGLFFTIGFIVLRETSDFLYAGGINSGFYFFIGMTITFGLLYLLNSEQRNLSWAMYPAMSCLGIAFIIGLANRYSFEGEIFVPFLFIAIGVYLLIKSSIRRKGNHDQHLEVQ